MLTSGPKDDFVHAFFTPVLFDICIFLPLFLYEEVGSFDAELYNSITGLSIQIHR